TDWDNVPRLDYRTEKFRQLAVPDPARVVEDASAFEPWQPRQLDEALGRFESAAPEPASLKGESDEQERDQRDTWEQSADSAQDSSEASVQSLSGDRDNFLDSQARAEESETASDTPQTAIDGALDAEAEQNAPDAVQQLSNAEDTTDQTNVTPDSAEPTLDSAALKEACEAARQEGLEKGREEGRQQALEESRQTHQQELEQAKADKARALQELREEIEGQIEPLKQQLNDAAEQVQSLLGRPEQLYEPVKRLSLHLAEQLVLGELNLSSVAIERLIQRCLDELDLHGNHVVTVELNPQDKARLQERAGEMTHTLSVQAVPSLQPGSVRVMINDTLVEDLVGNRLEALARNLLVQPEVWREQSPFFRQPLAQRDSEVQDASVRTLASRDSSPTVSAQGREADHAVEPASTLANDLLNEESSEPSRQHENDSIRPFDSQEDHHD
ncbi:MAG: hypothetical protein EBU72_13670, partial [Betaproteobacteria bacterium]|nr:hypothetical protein [Betaproteobacteria bacterium]